MFEIKITDESIMQQYLIKQGIKSEINYLFTFDKNYIFMVKENNSINTYYVICLLINLMVPILKSKIVYSDDRKMKLIEKFVATSHYRVALPGDPNAMIEFIFMKLMAKNGFNVRENQIELSKMMYSGIKQDHIAICEAAVGTGKTYAYIVASIVFALYRSQSGINTEANSYSENEKCTTTCVISTSSIDLQNAIIRSYIPILSDILKENKVTDHALSAVLRKGKEHYFCKMRYNRLMSYLKISKKTEDKELLKKLKAINIPGGSIDLDIYKGLKNHIIQKINVPKACDSLCHLYIECQYIKHMKYMKSSCHDFQVCNHNYYLADTIKRAKGKHTLIPDHSVVIIDEAHKLPDAAMQIFGTKFSSEDITVLAHVLSSNLKGNKVYFNTSKQKLENLCALRTEFFQSLVGDINLDAAKDESSQISIYIGSCQRMMLMNMLEIIESLKKYCMHDISKSRSLEIMIEEIAKQIEAFYHTENIIYWLENPMSEKLVSVCCIPKDLEYKLQKVLWENGIPKILTSATLSEARSFNYFKINTGIDKINKNYLSEMSCTSPFDYKNNALMYISENIPFPDKQSDGYVKAITDEIIKLVEATYGHTVILFTSYSLLSKVYELSKDRIEYPVLKMEKRVKNTLETFKNSGNGVLFATGSFWEGVDCPGDILSSLIIVNLPFPTPTPILEHKKKQYTELQEFIKSIIFPEMLIKLKQGMGRLIRCETDTGLISILDFRISKKGNYRRWVLESHTEYKVTDSIREVKKFFRKVKKEEYFLL